MPHPINFALNKLIVSNRRGNVEKTKKDRNTAIEVLKCLIYKGEEGNIKNVFSMLSGKRKNIIISELEKEAEKTVIDILT